jgi:hypothetical protein
MRTYALLSLFFIILISCKEENPGIILKDPPPPLKDTTYIATDVGAQDFKRALLEDLTGVRCVNCPQAAAKAKELSNKFKDTLVVMALYVKSFETQFTSPWDGHEDLRTDVAENIANAVGMPTGLPGGYVDRHRFTSQASLFISQWENAVKERIGGASPVRIELDYEALANNEIIIKSKLTYTQDRSSEQHKVALYITENNIIGKQATNEPGRSPYIIDYSHEHVLRSAITQPLGNLLTSPLTLGRVFEKDFSFEWPAAWNRNKCYLVGVVMDARNESVIQVAQIKLY